MTIRSLSDEEIRAVIEAWLRTGEMMEANGEPISAYVCDRVREEMRRTAAGVGGRAKHRTDESRTGGMGVDHVISVDEVDCVRVRVFHDASFTVFVDGLPVAMKERSGAVGECEAPDEVTMEEQVRRHAAVCDPARFAVAYEFASMLEGYDPARWRNLATSRRLDPVTGKPPRGRRGAR